jgi:hypothetical protein
MSPHLRERALLVEQQARALRDALAASDGADLTSPGWN